MCLSVCGFCVYVFVCLCVEIIKLPLLVVRRLPVYMNAGWLHFTARRVALSLFASHLQNQHHSYVLRRTSILLIHILHSHNQEASHRGILHYLNPLHHEQSIFPTYILLLHRTFLHLQHHHTSSSAIHLHPLCITAKITASICYRILALCRVFGIQSASTLYFSGIILKFL